MQKKKKSFGELTPLDLIQKYAKARKKEPCQVRIEFAAAVEHYEQISYRHSGPETCTSSACPAADWGKALSLYSVRLAEIYRSPKDIKAKQRILGRTWILFGWSGLLHQNEHEIAGKLYSHLSDDRSRQQRKVATSTLDDFRRWYASR